MKTLFLASLATAALASCSLFTNQEGSSLFERDFNQATPENCLDGLSIYEGNFGLKKLGDDRCLQSAVAEMFQGFMFGPEDLDSLDCRADFYPYITESAMPTFGLGTHGVKGPRLIACQNDSHPELRLIFGQDTLLGRHPFALKPQAWHTVRFRTERLANGRLRCRGKIWARNAPEPSYWMIDIQIEGEIKTGQASAWCVTFSGRPVYIDNLKQSAVNPIKN